MLNHRGTEGMERDWRIASCEWYGSVKHAMTICGEVTKRLLLHSYKAKFNGMGKVGVVDFEGIGLKAWIKFTWRKKENVEIPDLAVAMARAAELGMERVLEEMERWERDLERKTDE